MLLLELLRADFLHAGVVGVVAASLEELSVGSVGMLGAPATVLSVFRYCFIQLGVDGVVVVVGGSGVGGGGADNPGLGGEKNCCEEGPVCLCCESFKGSPVALFPGF